MAGAIRRIAQTAVTPVRSVLAADLIADHDIDRAYLRDDPRFLASETSTAPSAVMAR